MSKILKVHDEAYCKSSTVRWISLSMFKVNIYQKHMRISVWGERKINPIRTRLKHFLAIFRNTVLYVVRPKSVFHILLSLLIYCIPFWSNVKLNRRSKECSKLKAINIINSKMTGLAASTYMYVYKSQMGTRPGVCRCKHPLLEYSWPVANA